VSRALAGLALALLFLSTPASGQLEAVQIDAGNAERLLIGGPDAIGGIGDWYLGNDRVEVIVDDPGRRHGTLNHGGTLVDAGVRGRRGEDQLGRLSPLVNLDQRVQLGYDAARAELDSAGGYARLVVTGRGGMSVVPRPGGLPDALNPLVPDSDAIAPVIPETVYEVRPGEPFVRVTTTLRNTGDAAAPVFAYGDVWMRGGRSMRAFVGNTQIPERASGFHHRSFDRKAILEASGAMASSTFVAMAGLPHFPPVGYAVASPARAKLGRLQFGVTGKHITLVNVFVGDEGWREVGALRLARATFDAIPPGESFVFARRFYVSGGRGVASLTDEIFPDLGFATGESGVAGRIEPAGIRASVRVETAAGAPVTQASVAREGPDAGRYRAVLPPGSYTLVLDAEQREPRRVRVEVPAVGFAEAPPQRFEEPGWLVIPRAFSDGGPGRLVVVGRGDTPDPVFEPELVDFRIDGGRPSSGSESNSLLFVGGPSDPRRVAIAPGRYRVLGTRGPEFTFDAAEVDLAGPGATVELAPFEVERVVVLEDAVSADLHVHGQASDDSGISNSMRLAGYVAEHVDVMVSTDHDHLGRYESALDALGVRDRIRVIQGVEITSSTPSRAAPWTIGHHNAWPVPYRPLAHRKGAPPSQERSVAGLYALLRRDYGARVVQLNHALPEEPGEDGESFFSHLATVGEPYDPTLPLDDWPNRVLLELAADGATRAIDFDALEVMNGDEFGEYLQLREAWYWLLRQGLQRTATGNSDSHGPAQNAAYPRNYVTLAGEFDAAGFDAAVREGRVFATTGPLITRFRVGGGEMGDLVPAPGGSVALHVAVDAAPWVPVDEVRILVDGEVARTFRSLPDAGAVRRLDERFELTIRRDAFVTVEAGIALDADWRSWASEHTGPYADLAPGFVPQAISNPIWIDAGGDGRFTPPGLASSALGSAAERRLGVLLALILAMAVVWFWRRRKAGRTAPRR
jgi:hypothetical protein